jgi:hypothetical protein
MASTLFRVFQRAAAVAVRRLPQIPAQTLSRYATGAATVAAAASGLGKQQEPSLFRVFAPVMCCMLPVSTAAHRW